MESKSHLRALPSVDRALHELGEVNLPRPVVLAVVRRELDRLRQQTAPDGDALTHIRAALDELKRAKIQPLINGTGIIIHTNFGRSPMSATTADALVKSATLYSNLEYDLRTGERGARAEYLEHNLAVLCEAPAATVVNNCAAALVLILRHFTSNAQRKRVVISRGELVQIGGGFRIPEILEAAGATLHEIGTTNKTTLADYQEALSDQTALILKVHQSNFFMSGFVDSVGVSDLAPLAHVAGIPLVVDLGSGATFDTISLGGEREPLPSETIAAGADVVTFSGDKLLGGPQAGIIAGDETHVAALKRDPFFRALRCDKLIFAALQETVDHLLAGRTDQIPIRVMIEASLESLRERAEKIVRQLATVSAEIQIIASEAQLGGGTLPRTVIPSIALAIRAPRTSAGELAKRLRNHNLPLIGYVADDALRIDLRTVFESQDEQVAHAIAVALTDSTR